MYKRQLCTSGYTCGVLGSIASVALYNFFLTEPRLTFHAYDPGYQVTFALMLTSAIITCTLTTRLKDHAKMSAQAAFRTKILFDTNQLLQRAKSEKEILSQTASQLMTVSYTHLPYIAVSPSESPLHFADRRAESVIMGYYTSAEVPFPRRRQPGAPL